LAQNRRHSERGEETPVRPIRDLAGSRQRPDTGHSWLVAWHPLYNLLFGRVD
jgi:hypothetical protein